VQAVDADGWVNAIPNYRVAFEYRDAVGDALRHQAVDDASKRQLHAARPKGRHNVQDMDTLCAITWRESGIRWTVAH
jgi:hypothetical protein